MEQCSYCGFVLQASDAGCPNCGAADNARRPLQADDPVPQQIVTHYGPTRRRRTPRWLKPLLALLLVAALLSLPQAQPYLQQLDDLLGELSTPYYEVPETLTMTMMRNFTIFLGDPVDDRGTTDESDDQPNSASWRLALSEPGHRPSGPQGVGNDWQELLSLEANPVPDSRSGKMVWEGTLTGDERVDISVVYQVRVNTILIQLVPEDSGTVGEVPAGWDAFLQDEWKIEPSDPQVQVLAAELAAGTDGNVLQILRNIFDYIMGNFDYVLGAVPRSCQQTLAHGYGDCDDLGLLFASLSRAAGIPAWMEMGMIPRSADNLQDWGGHAWVNALVPLANGNLTVVTADLANGYFLWMPPYRLSEWVDNGDPDDLKAFYFLFSSQGKGTAGFSEDLTVASWSQQGQLRIAV